MKVKLGNFANYIWNSFVTHIPIHGFRLFFLRLFNSKISKHAIILMHTRILHFWNLEIGDGSIINQNCFLDCRRYLIQIEDHVDIGAYTRIWTLGHDPNSESHEVKGGAVAIRHHVWIASGVTILPNIELAVGSVIGSGSVLTKSTKTNEIWAGNPATFIKKRENDLKYKIHYLPFFE